MMVSSLNDIPAVRDYLARVGAEPRSLKTAVVRETRGAYWTDVAVIRFGKNGAVSCSTLEHGATEMEQMAITAAWSEASFPRIKLLHSIINPPPMIREAAPRDVFEFRTLDGSQILMVQVRIERMVDGVLKKNYVPFTYWEDDKWRQCEPDGELPLWGLDQLRHNKVVFIHEGAKAAARCREMVEGKSREDRERMKRHPWREELANAAHLGWIGGALNPARTDWSVLREQGIERAFIVADNDEPGKRAISRIAERLRCITFSVEFNDTFPAHFDLGDPFPDDMFKQANEGAFYVGPTMRDLMNPATWATDIVPSPTGKGRPLTVLRDEFKRLWAYVEEADVYVCIEMPEIIRSETVLNKMLAGFSHATDTAKLINKAYKGRSAKLCYRPDQTARIVDYRGTNAINLFTPARVRPVKGDVEPWLEFLRYLCVVEEERREVERWCATLIARPEVRMGYGLLLVSETQGVGKTTLGAQILAPLVGHQNVAYPGEGDVVGVFNDWVAHKRLAIVNEIYSGSSWKAYNALKSIITDREVCVNQKYMRQYTIENWCHILACSNSMRALKMENDDRRWFYPELTELPWPAAKFSALRHWLSSGGLSLIAQWAMDYGSYVSPAARAPMTGRKRDLIDGSRSEAQQEAAALAELLRDREAPGALLMKSVTDWVRSSAHGKVHDSDYELRRAMKDVGLQIWPDRIKANGRLQYAVLNAPLFDLCRRSDDPFGLIRERVVRPEELLPERM